MGAEEGPLAAGKVWTPSSSEWAAGVLDDLLTGVARSHTRLDGRFPLYRHPGQEWVSSRRGSWTGGMWTGLLWLRALRSEEPEDVAAATRTHLALDVWSNANTATRGLIFWYPLALSRLAVVPDRQRVEVSADRSVRSLLVDFSPKHGVVPWGDAFGGPSELIRVDGSPGVALLMSRASGATAESVRVGAEHLLVHLRGCWNGRVLTPVRTLGTCASYTTGTDYWARGRAWLLSGFADALALGLVGPDDTDLLRLLEARAPLVPPVETEGLGAEVDTGAAAIEVAALLRVANRLPDPDRARRVRTRALGIVRLLVGTYLAEDGCGLVGGSYDTRQGLVCGIESVWGDFFLALAAAMIAGVVPIDQC